MGLPGLFSAHSACQLCVSPQLLEQNGGFGNAASPGGPPGSGCSGGESLAISRRGMVMGE